VLDRDLKVFMIRNGSCGDPVLKSDVPRIVRALEELDLMTDETTIAVDQGPPVIPRLEALRARRGRSRSSPGRP
jgi:hypothetical protein